MKKIVYIILIFVVGTVFTACNDEFLERTPLDQISGPDFWNNESDMQLYLNGMYDTFYGWDEAGSGAAPTKDLGTDIAVPSLSYWGGGTVNQRMEGILPVPASGGGWGFGNIRRVNYFLENVDKAEDGDLKNHYVGEGYFLRAWFYFGILKNFGDLPIIDQIVNVADEDILYGARSSRSDVVDFILGDLDKAIANMKAAPDLGLPGRLNKDIASLFKARVALFEGSWEKYHEGTAFAGKTNGSAYLTAAAAAAKSVIDRGNYSLYRPTGDVEDYHSLFVQTNYDGNSEVMFAKHYLEFVTTRNDLWNWPGAWGISHEMTKNYLCTDGLPTAVSTLFTDGDDDTFATLEANRDPRLEMSVMVPGELDFVALDGTEVMFADPQFDACPTGYQSEKFRTRELVAGLNRRTGEVGFIFFRYAEALLIYAEARAELGLLDQADADLTINDIRSRVGMPALNVASITVDPNWPDYGTTLTPILYEIRRERVVELFGEGYRFDDLMRWRAHKLFQGKRPTGTFYTDAIKVDYPTLIANEEGFLDPLVTLIGDDGYGFNETRDYLMPIPTNEQTLNPALGQNPNWQ
jgi:hypothetical protein